MVQIQRDGNNHCSGSLISPTMVLTAGHCLDGYDAGQISVRLPNLGGVTRQATERVRKRSELERNG